VSGDVEVVLPSAREHLDGTLALFDHHCAQAGGHSHAAAVRAFLAESPVSTKRDLSLKFDAYRATRGWGVTINDHHEPNLFARAASFAGGVPSVIDQLRARLPAARLTLGIGFDDPRAPPRWKFYFQEEPVGRGIARAGELAAWCAVALPPWLAADRTVGVATIDLPAGAPPRLKLYLGGKHAVDAAANTTDTAHALAVDLAARCPLPAAYHYLTIRLTTGAPPRIAINKIYDYTRGFTKPPDLDSSWTDALALSPRLARVTLAGVRVLPTATALEDDGGVDLYCAAWRC
jgi:hypothetical protein